MSNHETTITKYAVLNLFCISLSFTLLDFFSSKFELLRTNLLLFCVITPDNSSMGKLVIYPSMFYMFGGVDDIIHDVALFYIGNAIVFTYITTFIHDSLYQIDD